MNKQTHEMLYRVAAVLGAHSPEPAAFYADALALRRISMTLHRWHELECGDSNVWNSFVLVRGLQSPDKTKFEHTDDGEPFLEIHHGSGGVSYIRQADKERGALKRMAKIMEHYPSLQSYVQTDPRGASLYILRPGDVREGQSVDSCYSNGIAVYK